MSAVDASRTTMFFGSLSIVIFDYSTGASSFSQLEKVTATDSARTNASAIDTILFLILFLRIFHISAKQRFNILLCTTW